MPNKDGTGPLGGGRVSERGRGCCTVQQRGLSQGCRPGRRSRFGRPWISSAAGDPKAAPENKAGYTEGQTADPGRQRAGLGRDGKELG